MLVIQAVAALIKRPPALVEMTSVGEGRADLPQAHALAGLRARSVQLLGERHRAPASRHGFFALRTFLFHGASGPSRVSGARVTTIARRPL